MKLPRNWKLSLAGFAFGSAFLLAFFFAFNLFGKEIGTQLIAVQSVFFPRWWLFEANPVLLIICNLLKADLCYGLGFDGGPLEWAEYLWIFTSPGILYGLIFLVIGNLWKRIQASKK